MSLGVKQTLNYPGPTTGVTVLSSEVSLTSFYDVVAAPAADQQIAILSISAGYTASPQTDTQIIIASGNSNTVVMAVDSGGRATDHAGGFLYPPLLPAGEKLSIKSTSSSGNVCVYIQYMIVPV